MARDWGRKYPFKGGYYTVTAIYNYYKEKNIPVTENLIDAIRKQEGVVDETIIIKLAKESIIKRQFLPKGGKYEKACIEEFGKEAWNEICHNRKDTYLFKGKYYSLNEIWLYYMKCGISVNIFRKEIREKEAEGELIDEEAIIEIVKRCIVKIGMLKPFIKTAIIDEFGEETLNEILEARKLDEKELSNNGRNVYPFKGQYYTSKKIWIYYARCGISISNAMFREKIKEKEAMGELIDEEAIIEIVKKCIVRVRYINSSMEKAIVEEFSEEALNEILEARKLKVNKRCKEFRDTMKSDATISVETRNIDSDNGISLRRPQEIEK